MDVQEPAPPRTRLTVSVYLTSVPAIANNGYMKKGVQCALEQCVVKLMTVECAAVPVFHLR
jgi:hypothetical protein